VTDAARPRRRRATDASPDLQFLTPVELDAVFAVIPDVVVDRDSLGPVLRLVILVAGTTGIRQSELLGLRWRDVDVAAQRIRVRSAWVRGEHSGEGKSDLSTSRSVPMTDRLALELRSGGCGLSSAKTMSSCSGIRIWELLSIAPRSRGASRPPAMKPGFE
jgi:integrase